MKVFICGANGTGKTKVLDSLDTHLTKIRGLIRGLNYDLDKQLDFDSDEYRDLQLSIFTYSITDWMRNDNFICSNSLINILAYTKYASDSIGIKEHRRTATENEKYNCNMLEHIISLSKYYMNLIHNSSDVTYLYIPLKNDLTHVQKGDITPAQIGVDHYIRFFLDVFKLDAIYINDIDNLSDINSILN